MGGSSKILGKNVGWSFVIPPRTWGIAVYPLGVISDEVCSFIDELKLSSLATKWPKKGWVVEHQPVFGSFFFPTIKFVSNNKLIWTFPNSSHFDSFVFFFPKMLDAKQHQHFWLCHPPKRQKPKPDRMVVHPTWVVIVRETPKCPEEFRFRNRKNWVRWSDHSTRFSSFTFQLPTWKMDAPSRVRSWYTSCPTGWHGKIF